MLGKWGICSDYLLGRRLHLRGHRLRVFLLSFHCCVIPPQRWCVGLGCGYGTIWSYMYTNRRGEKFHRSACNFYPSFVNKMKPQTQLHLVAICYTAKTIYSVAILGNKIMNLCRAKVYMYFDYSRWSLHHYLCRIQLSCLSVGASSCIRICSNSCLKTGIVLRSNDIRLISMFAFSKSQQNLLPPVNYLSN